MNTKSPGPTPPADDVAARNERDLYRIMTWSTALGFGVLAAFLGSLKDIKNDVSFQFSITTVLGFVAGAVAGWLFWKVLRRMMEQAKDRPD